MTAACAHEHVISTTDFYAKPMGQGDYGQRHKPFAAIEQRGWCKDCSTRVRRVSPIVALGAWDLPRDPETQLHRPACG